MYKLILFLAALGLLFTANKSTAQWTPTNYPADISAYDIVKCGSNLFAGSNGQGVYKSTDNGLNWFQSGLTYYSVNTMAVREPYIFAGTEGVGVLVSSDNGNTWVQSYPNEDMFVKCILVKGSDVFMGVETMGVWRSIDNGYNWSQTSLTTTTVWNLGANDTYLFAGGTSRIRRSSDNGASYSITMVGNGVITSIASSGNYLFTAAYNVPSPLGILYSTNEGANWTQTTLNNKTIFTIVTSGTYVLAGSYQNGVYSSSDYGVNWVQKNEGLPTIPYFTNLYEAGDYLFVVTDIYNTPMWRRLKSELVTSAAPVLVSPENNSIINIFTPELSWESLPGAASYNLNVSTDAGFGTTVINLTGLTGTIYNIPAGILQDSTSYYWKVSAGAGGWSDAWKFTVNIPVTQEYAVEKITIVSEEVLELLNSNIINQELYDMLVSKLNNSVKQINLIHYDIAINRIEQFIFEVNLLKKNNILTPGQAQPLLTDAYRIISMLNILIGSPSQPEYITSNEKNFVLNQNYPNPFNQLTVINYQIPIKSIVTLKVYDLLGREVASLVNETLQPGIYDARFDGSRLASGIYYYVLQSQNFREVKRMVLIK
jgi:hypothetical protein